MCLFRKYISYFCEVHNIITIESNGIENTFNSSLIFPLRTSCGSGFIAITSSKKINFTMWHRVTARKVNGKIYLQVNDELLISGGRNCHSGDLYFHRIYLGGLQPDTLQERNVGLIPGFAGCMRKFTLDQKEFILRSKESINMNGIDIGKF